MMKLRTYFLSWYIQLISTRAAALVIKVFNVSEVPGTQPLPVFTKCSIYHFSFPGPSPGFPQTSSHFKNEMPSFLGVEGVWFFTGIILLGQASVSLYCGLTFSTCPD